jgi:glycosyltransferase involved in cell wall biosynthesis
LSQKESGEAGVPDRWTMLEERGRVYACLSGGVKTSRYNSRVNPPQLSRYRHPVPDRPLNILQVCDHLGWEGSRMHGVKRLFSWMIPRFDRERFRVSLVSLRKKDLSEETLDALGIDITYLERSKFDPGTLSAMLRLVDAKQIDVLHLHGYGATTFGRLAGAMRGIPSILHEHANLTDTPWFQKVADRLLAPSTDIAIAVSKSTADFVIHARQMPAEKVKVVYLGVPLEEFSGPPPSAADVDAARRALGILPGDFAVGTVTRLHESKGNQYLVSAAAQVVAARPNARFVLVGEGPLRGDLERQAAALGLEDRFVFAGFQRDVARTLSAFDLSVFPSLWEGTPITAFEALAMGKAIVSTDADGLLDILTAGGDAAIVPRADASALAAEIVRMMDRPDERARLSAAARQTGKRYDIGLFVRRMERLYTLLHDRSSVDGRNVILREDVSFLTSDALA